MQGTCRGRAVHPTILPSPIRVVSFRVARISPPPRFPARSPASSGDVSASEDGEPVLAMLADVFSSKGLTN